MTLVLNQQVGDIPACPHNVFIKFKGEGEFRGQIEVRQRSGLAISCRLKLVFGLGSGAWLSLLGSSSSLFSRPADTLIGQGGPHALLTWLMARQQGLLGNSWTLLGGYQPWLPILQTIVTPPPPLHSRKCVWEFLCEFLFAQAGAAQSLFALAATFIPGFMCSVRHVSANVRAPARQKPVAAR